MLLEVKCLCGYRCRVEEERAGERIPCATCWRSILIPPREAANADPTADIPTVLPANEVARSLPEAKPQTAAAALSTPPASETLVVKCLCGHIGRVSVEKAGQTAPCPSCWRMLNYPSLEEFTPKTEALPPPPSDLPSYIPFLCRCGKTLRAPAQLIGQSIHCPLCEREVIVPDPRPPEPIPTVDEPAPPQRSLRDHFYWVLLLALAPLFLSIFRPEPTNVRKRLDKALQDHPELKKKVDHPDDYPDFTLDDLLKALPGEKLDEEAYLPRSSQQHWNFAAVVTLGFFILGCLLFAKDMSQRKDLLLVGLFTGTLGVVLLLGVKSILGLSFMDEILLESSSSPLGLRLLVFTLSVGLFEELFKALPLLWHYRHKATLDWRGACLWGMASGVGFGISESIEYSSMLYHGIASQDVYLLRFLSCVALHAVWSASVGITLSQYHRYIKGGLDSLIHGDVEWHEVVIPVLRVLAVPMILHGLYDTLIARETYALGLLVALLSFAWLGWQIESQREQESETLPSLPTATKA